MRFSLFCHAGLVPGTVNELSTHDRLILDLEKTELVPLGRSFRFGADLREELWELLTKLGGGEDVGFPEGVVLAPADDVGGLFFCDAVTVEEVQELFGSWSRFGVELGPEELFTCSYIPGASVSRGFREGRANL